MTQIEKKTFESPDEVHRPYEKGRYEILRTRLGPVKRITLQPGYRWSQHTKPVVGTELCELSHVKLFLRGRFRVRMRDGAEVEFGPDEIGTIAPGHDAWVVGDESCSFIDLADITL